MILSSQLAPSMSKLKRNPPPFWCLQLARGADWVVSIPREKALYRQKTLYMKPALLPPHGLYFFSGLWWGGRFLFVFCFGFCFPSLRNVICVMWKPFNLFPFDLVCKIICNSTIHLEIPLLTFWWTINSDIFGWHHTFFFFFSFCPFLYPSFGIRSFLG